MALASFTLPLRAGATAVDLCLGDCDGNGRLAASDVLRLTSLMTQCGTCADGLSISAEGCAAVPDGCVAADADDDGCVAAGEVARAVKNATLAGCTGAGASVPRRAAGLLESASSVFLRLPRAIGAVLGPVASFGAGGTAAGIFDFNEPFFCPDGGGGSLACDQEATGFPPSGPPIYTITLDSCAVITPAGRTVTFEGEIAATGQLTDLCGTLPSPLRIETPNLRITDTGENDAVVATFSGFTAITSFAGSNLECLFDQLAMELAGRVAVVSSRPVGNPVATTQAIFAAGSTAEIAISQYGGECVPLQYVETVNGGVTFVDGHRRIAASFSGFELSDDATGEGDDFDIAGSVQSDCLGTPVSFATQQTFARAAGALCPASGEVVLGYVDGASPAQARLRYGVGVEIDVDADGGIDDTFSSCVDPALYVCPAP